MQAFVSTYAARNACYYVAGFLSENMENMSLGRHVVARKPPVIDSDDREEKSPMMSEMKQIYRLEKLDGDGAPNGGTFHNCYE